MEKIDLFYTQKTLCYLKCYKLVDKVEIIEDVKSLPLGVYPAKEYFSKFTEEQLKTTIGYVNVYNSTGEHFSPSVVDEVTKDNGYDIKILKITIKGGITQYYAVAEKFCNSKDFTGIADEENKKFFEGDLYLCAVYEAVTPNTVYPCDDRMAISYSPLTNGSYAFTDTVIQNLDNIIDYYADKIYADLYKKNNVTMTKLKELFKQIKKAFNSMSLEQLIRCSSINTDMSCTIHTYSNTKKGQEAFQKWLNEDWRDEDVVKKARNKKNIAFYGEWDMDFVVSKNEFIRDFIWLDWFEGKNPFDALKYETFSPAKIKNYYVTLLTNIYRHDIYIHYMD